MSTGGSVFRVGLIGCGRVGSEWDPVPPIPLTHAGAFFSHPRTRLVAGANRGMERLQAFGRKWGVEALYQDYRQMLEREKLDIVAIATHPELHCEQVVAAAEAGVKAIFCEKPFAISLAEADEMLAACRRSGTIMSVNHTRRWETVYRKAAELVKGGAIGELLRVETHFLGGKPNPAWRADEEGPLLHDATHSFDLFRMFGGDVDWVLATAVKRKRPLPVEDESLAIFQFRNGVTGVSNVDELAEYTQFDVTLFGSHGRLLLSDAPPLLWSVEKSPSMEKELDPSVQWFRLKPQSFPEVEAVPPMKGAIDDLIECLDTGRSPLCTGEDGRAAVEIVMGIYESQRRGNVKVPLPLPSGKSSLYLLREQGML